MAKRSANPRQPPIVLKRSLPPMPSLRDIALKIGYGPQDNRLRDFAGAKALPETRLRPLMGEVLRMTVASIKTLRARNPKSQIQNPK